MQREGQPQIPLKCSSAGCSEAQSGGYKGGKKRKEAKKRWQLLLPKLSSIMAGVKLEKYMAQKNNMLNYFEIEHKLHSFGEVCAYLQLCSFTTHVGPFWTIVAGSCSLL